MSTPDSSKNETEAHKDVLDAGIEANYEIDAGIDGGVWASTEAIDAGSDAPDSGVLAAPMVLVFSHTEPFTVRLALTGIVDVQVDWGDDTTELFTAPGDTPHDYEAGGTYTVTLQGEMTGFRGVSLGTEYLVSCLSFGSLGLQDLRGAFKGAQNLTQAPLELPSSVTDLSEMFWDADAFNQDIGHWQTGNVTRMNATFRSADVFNQDIGAWDTHNVTDMSYMFSEAVFNQDIGDWNTGNVTSMNAMFMYAAAFNQGIVGEEATSSRVLRWDTGNVTTLSKMFYEAHAFNQDITAWDTHNVTDMSGMFYGAYAFDQPLAPWQTDNVVSMSFMFWKASAFNQNLSSWCVSQFSFEPTDFDDGADAWEGGEDTRPSWGETCD